MRPFDCTLINSVCAATTNTTMSAIIKELAKKAIMHGIRAVNPRELVQKHVAFQDNHILIHAPNGGPTLRYPLGADRRVVVLGAGKATAEMCQGLIDAANHHSSNDKYNLYGAINIPKGQSQPNQFGGPNSNINIKINFAAHPILDQSTIDGTLEQLRIINETATDQPRAVVVLMSGGGSSLFEVPQAPLTLQDLQTINGQLLRSGADITELNAVRKHLSAVKGGQLARHVIEGTSRDSVLISLVLSDVIGDPLDVIASGPTVPDTTSYTDAARVIHERIEQRGEQVPPAVLQHVQRGVAGELPETPKPGAPLFEHVTNHVIGSALTAELAVSQLLRESGVQHVTVVTRSMKGEAREVGRSLPHMIAGQLRGELTGPGQCGAMNSLGRELRDTDQLVALLCTGECTVTVKGKGRGGRNQELLLAALVESGMGLQSRDSVHEWQQHWDWTVIAAAFDGIEGNSPAMGAVIDASSVSRIHEQQLNARDRLEQNDSYHVFQALGDALEVGHTGTNVNDMLLVLLKRK